MKKYRKILVIVTVLCIVFTLAACGGSSPSSSSDSGGSSSSSSEGGGSTAPATNDWDGIDLKIVTNYPAGAETIYIVEYWLDQVTARTDGKVTGTIYAGETLMKQMDQLPGVLDGTADMVVNDPAYNPEYFPLLASFFLPGLVMDNSTVVTHMASDLIRDSDFAELKQLKMMWANGLSPPTIQSNKKFETLEDFKGLQIRISGFGVDSINMIGSTAVALPASEVYEALLKGTVDATYMGSDALAVWGTAEVVKYVIRAPGFYNLFHYVGMNNDTWNSIPAEYQTIIEDLNKECIDVQAPRWDAIADVGEQLLLEKGGEIYSISDAEMARIFDVTASMRADWVAKMDAQGLDGQAALDRVDTLAAMYNEQYGNK